MYQPDASSTPVKKRNETCDNIVTNLDSTDESIFDDSTFKYLYEY